MYARKLFSLLRDNFNAIFPALIRFPSLNPEVIKGVQARIYPNQGSNGYRDINARVSSYKGWHKRQSYQNVCRKRFLALRKTYHHYSVEAL